MFDNSFSISREGSVDLPKAWILLKALIATIKSSLESCLYVLEVALEPIYPFLYVIIACSIISSFQAPYLPRLDTFWKIQITLQIQTTF
jgi:hypothetical protein